MREWVELPGAHGGPIRRLLAKNVPLRMRKIRRCHGYDLSVINCCSLTALYSTGLNKAGVLKMSDELALPFLPGNAFSDPTVSI